MRIVRANREDIELLAPLFDSYRQFYKQPSDQAKAREFILERLSKEESVIFLAVDESDQKTVGLGFTQLYPSFSSISMKRLWILNDLFVSQLARKQGIGRELMKSAEEFARETNSIGIVLETASDNYQAQALYEQLGYKRDEHYYSYFLY